MRVVWIVVGGAGGLGLGAVVGFCVALVAMSFTAAPHDGTYGMREVILCLPSGALLGLIAGLYWGAH